MQKSDNRVTLEELYMTYSHDINALVGPLCVFGAWPKLEICSEKDFVTVVTSWGKCYTINSGIDGQVKTVDKAGVASGLKVILDAQVHDYSIVGASQGFKVLVHGQGEYINVMKGTNVGPGQHAFMALSQKRVCSLLFALLCLFV